MKTAFLVIVAALGAGFWSSIRDREPRGELGNHVRYGEKSGARFSLKASPPSLASSVFTN